LHSFRPVLEVARFFLHQPRDPPRWRTSEENSSTFWNLFASGAPERAVEKATAIYVIRRILSETIGPHQVGKVEFLTETVTISDILSILEIRAPGSAWQAIQRKAGYKASS
jgi:hypothetical protein